MKSPRSSSRRKKRRRTTRKLFRKLGTGMTGKIHTQGATATGRTWADALAAGSRAWRCCKNCLCPGDEGVNAVYICRGSHGCPGDTGVSVAAWCTRNVGLSELVTCGDSTELLAGGALSEGSGCLRSPGWREPLKEKNVNSKTALCIVGGCIYFFSSIF